MPRSHTNPYPSDTLENCLLENLNHRKILGPIESKLSKFKSQLWTRIENSLGDIIEGGDISIYTGYTGIALLYYIAGIRQEKASYLQRAEEICNVAIQNLKNKRFSFLNGDAGPVALGAVIYNVNGKKAESNQLVKRLMDMTEKVFFDVTIPDEVLYGRAGYLYALLFVNKHIRDHPVKHEIIRKVVESIINSGIIRAKQEKNLGSPLMYDWHGKKYLGAAHGMAGILYMLLCAREDLTESELSDLVRPTLDWLVKYRYQGNNFASSVNSGTDRLVQWCHGAPGFINLLLLASKVYKDEKYYSIALESSDVVWRRGLIQKGYSICHGVAGNAYTFMSLYKHTKEEIHWYRLACFLDWCSHYPRDQELRPDRPFSLFEGIAGLLYFLEDSKEPENSLFPAFELD